MPVTQNIVEIAYAATLFLTGLAMGSFLNVVACRAPKGISLLTPPSTCPQCGTEIAAYDNLPVIGYLMLGGKCRRCRKKIPARYLLAELATGALWAATGWKIAGLNLGYRTNIAVGLVWLAFVSAAVVTFIVDCDFMIVLDEISIGGGVLTLAVAPFLPFLHHAHDAEEFSRYHMVLAELLPSGPPWLWSGASSLLGAAAGFGFSAFILYAGSAAFRKRIAEAQKHDPDVQTALGWGDVKLMAFYGAFFGWFAVLVIFIVASVLGALVGTAAKLVGGGPGGAAIPFAPFLVVGALACFFFGPEIFALLHRG